MAWQLGVHTHAVHLDPVAPAVVLRARTTSRAPVGPSLRGLGGEDGVRTLAATPRWRIVGTCGTSTTGPPA